MLIVTALCALVACHPVAAVTLRGALRPTPATECPQRALAMSSLVDSIRPSPSNSSGGSIMVRLRDPGVVEVLEPWVFVGLREAAKDSTELEITFRVPGRPTWAVDAEESRRLAEVGRALADDVVTRCAPNSPARFTCRVSGAFRTKDCGTM